MDSMKHGMGKTYLSEPDIDPTLFGGVGTDFAHSNFMVGDSVILPIGGRQSPETHSIAKILGSEQLRLKNPFKAPEVVRRLTAKTMQNNNKSVHVGTSFKVAPHIDQSKMFNAVFDELSLGGCVGIFPEGGSHDRSDLLPLKTGVAMMALEQLGHSPEGGLYIIPVV